MFNVNVTDLPAAKVGKILILRTAAGPQMRWAIDRVREAYPDVNLAVLGTHLGANEMFGGMEHFELGEPWLSRKSFKPLRKRVEQAGFDVVVMCLNSETGAGYGKVSRVVASIPARWKLVAGYKGRWYSWDRRHFDEGSLVTRGVFRAIELLAWPAVAVYLLLIPPRPSFMPAGQGRPAPGYDR